MKNILLGGLLLLMFTACSKDDENSVDYAAIDDQLILDYLAENDLDATKHTSGLYYKITSPGTGDQVYSNASVTIRYTGRLLDGTVFDSGKLTSEPLRGLITAWKIGIPLLKEGSEAILYCPSDLAYGKQATGSIPAHSVLIFDIEVISFR